MPLAVKVERKPKQHDGMACTKSVLGYTCEYNIATGHGLRLLVARQEFLYVVKCIQMYALFISPTNGVTYYVHSTMKLAGCASFDSLPHCPC